MKRVIVCGLLALLFAAACLLLRLEAARTQTVRTQYPTVAQEQALVGAERDTRPAALADGERIDLNTADASELTLLPGIGETLAQRIVDYRAAQGGFFGFGFRSLYVLAVDAPPRNRVVADVPRADAHLA